MVEPMLCQSGSGGGPLAWAMCSTAYLGHSRSGDAFLVQESPAGVLVAVVDGLGHGDDAADVADRALVALGETAGRSPMACLTTAHKALLGSRGAAITVALLDPDGGRLTCVAVGNVEAAVFRRGDDGGPTNRWSVPMRGGLVGYRLPPLRESTAPLAPDDILVLATDGLAPAFLHAVDITLPAPDLARQLHGDYARADDDALVLVARCRAGRIAPTAVSARPSC